MIARLGGSVSRDKFFEIDRFTLAKNLGFKNPLRIQLIVYLIETLY